MVCYAIGMTVAMGYQQQAAVLLVFKHADTFDMQESTWCISCAALG